MLGKEILCEMVMEVQMIRVVFIGAQEAKNGCKK